MSTQTLNRTTAAILILEGLLMFVPLLVLGAAINWPASLDEPADIVLRAIYQEATAVRLGYFSYLIYSVLFFPVVVLGVRVAAGNEQLNIFVRLALGFGAVSALARTIGIIRWLVAMPALAVAYNAPDVSAQTQESITITYNMLNNFGGAIGEILGVSMFASFAMLMIAIVIFQNKVLPQWTGYFALVSFVALLVPALEIFGIDPGIFLSVSVAVVQFWFLFVGIYLLLPRSSQHEQLVPVPTN
jgi:hypothetical protein